MPRRRWVYNRHAGGVEIPPAVPERTTTRITRHGQKSGKYTRLDVRYRGALCYVDAFGEPAAPSRQSLRAPVTTLGCRVQTCGVS